MIDTVETLIQAAGADPAVFSDLVHRLGERDRLENLLVDEAMRVQSTNPVRLNACMTTIDRLRAVRG